MVPKWMGPYRITNLKDNKLAQLCNLKTQFVMANLISVDRLKLYKEASAPPNKKACCEDEESLENQIDLLRKWMCSHKKIWIRKNYLLNYYQEYLTVVT